MLHNLDNELGARTLPNTETPELVSADPTSPTELGIPSGGRHISK